MKTESMISKDKIFSYTAELESYAAILSDYMEIHEDIEEFLHASLIVDKMKENICKLNEFLK